MWRGIETELADSDLASAVTLKRCSSSLKKLATKPVADAVERTNAKWRDAAARVSGGCRIRGAASVDWIRAKIRRGLKRSEVLTTLNLSGNGIGSADAAAIAEALRGNVALKSLHISSNRLGHEGATAIANALKGNRVLKTLDLSNNQIRAEGAAAIAEALQGNAVLKKLYLRGNNIGDAGAVAIAEALRVNGVLKTINLRGNWLGTEGWCAIFAALRDNKKNKIESWDLSRQGINAEVAKVLAEYVSGSGVLKSLDVRCNKISGDAAQPLATAVLASPSLEIFGSVPLKELRANTLDKLDLSGKDLGVPEALVLAKLVEGSAVLKSIDLRFNGLGDEGKGAIRDAVSGRVGFKLEM